MTTKNKDGKRAAIYCRISDDKEGEGLGVERQRQDCEALARRDGFRVVGTFIDNDVSAMGHKRRPEWERLVDAIKDGAVDVIVCWHPDRLTRSPKEIEALVDLVEAQRIELVSVTAGHYDLSTSTGRMQARVVGAVARQASEHQGERIRRKHRERAEAGLWHGMVPYGYRRDGKSLVIVPERAAVVRETAKRIIEGESLRSIERDLNARGVPAAKGGRWTATSLRQNVMRAAVAGLREYREWSPTRDPRHQEPDVLVKGDWDEIIDEATWERVRRVLADPARKVRRAPRRYLLAGMVRTAAGDKMRSWPCDGRRMYAGPGVAVDAESCEAEVLRQMWGWLGRRDRVPVDAGEQATVDAAEALEALEVELRDLARQRAAGKIERVEWEVFAEDVRARMAEARERLGRERMPSSLARLLSHPKRLRADWDSWGDDAEGLRRRRDVLRHVIDHVEVTPHPRRGSSDHAAAQRVRVFFRA
jgi:DNA invertase Pin-like site-specific DNA recombinase